MQELATIVETGPDPAKDVVVRWRNGFSGPVATLSNRDMKSIFAHLKTYRHKLNSAFCMSLENPS